MAYRGFKTNYSRQTKPSLIAWNHRRTNAATSKTFGCISFGLEPSRRLVIKGQNRPKFNLRDVALNSFETHPKHLDKLLDLYLGNKFPKEVLTERKARLEQMLASLRNEQIDLAGHICKVTMTDDQLSYNKLCARLIITILSSIG